MKQDKEFGFSGELHLIPKLQNHSDGLAPLEQPLQKNEGE